MMRSVIRKYIKARSLTFWASLALVVQGLILATEPLHGFSNLTAALHNISGDIAPGMMINTGLAGIGLRAAIS